MKTTRRKFLSTAGAAGLASPLFPMSSRGAESAGRGRLPDAEARQAKLIEVLRQPVLKKELFTSPVIIQSVELLRWENSYLCRVRSADGAEGISVAHSGMRPALPDLPPQPAAILPGQGCSRIGSDPGEGLHLRIQLSLQRHLPRAAAGHHRVRHPRPARADGRPVARAVDR